MNDNAQTVMDPLEAFKRLARSASYHFADDSGGEWQLGYREKTRALAVFDQHPEFQDKMREAAQGELWASDFNRERPLEPTHPMEAR